MQPFGFKVVPLSEKKTKVPVKVAGQVMVDVQTLISLIGEMKVRTALRIQGTVPDGLKSKFMLTVGGGSPGSVGAGPGEGSEDLMDETLADLGAMLDFLGKGVVGLWMEDNLPEPYGRAAIARAVVDLADHLEGYKLVYGPADAQREFHRIDRDKLLAIASTDVSDMGGAAVGIVMADPVKRNRWLFSNGASSVPITFSDNISQSDIPSFAAAGPVIVTGNIRRGPDMAVSEIRGTVGCYTFPEVKFYRLMTPDWDKRLLNPATGVPGYDSARKLWTLVNDDLGVSVEKPSWDECVYAFHDYMQFLWETYAGDDGDFEGEEKDIRDLLLSMEPPF